MRKSPARNKFVVLLLAVCLGSLPAYAQKPQQKPAPRDRGVQDVTTTTATTVSVGPYYALVIGIDKYQYVQPLQTAAHDASEVAKVLQESYGFAPPKVLLDANATRSQILTALYAYRNILPENSNLLIYYAGHGKKDPATKKAYWLPVDAQPDSDVNWISASTITEEISALRSPHVLVISDSCYSGELVRDPGLSPIAINPKERDTYLRKMLESPSRNLMASGRDEPVVDGGRDGHSMFAYVLLESLRRIGEEGFTAADLFQQLIQPGVAGRSNQVPQYSIIQNSGHAYGDFVFYRGHPTSPGSIPFDILASRPLPEIACKTESASPGMGPNIQPGDMVPCKLLDQPLKWVGLYVRPQLPGAAAQTKWKAMLTVTVNEEGKVIDIKPRGGTSLQGMDSALKAAAQGWQTNPPLYQSKKVKSSFALDIDFGQ